MSRSWRRTSRFSSAPVSLDETAQRRAGLDPSSYVDQQHSDVEVLSRHFRLRPRFRQHHADLHTLVLNPGRTVCRSPALYVSAGIREPHSAIRRYLEAEPPDRTTPDCAAICLPDRS